MQKSIKGKDCYDVLLHQLYSWKSCLSFPVDLLDPKSLLLVSVCQQCRLGSTNWRANSERFGCWTPDDWALSKLFSSVCAGNLMRWWCQLKFLGSWKLPVRDMMRKTFTAILCWLCILSQIRNYTGLKIWREKIRAKVYSDFPNIEMCSIQVTSHWFELVFLCARRSTLKGSGTWESHPKNTM